MSKENRGVRRVELSPEMNEWKNTSVSRTRGAPAHTRRDLLSARYTFRLLLRPRLFLFCLAFPDTRNFSFTFPVRFIRRSAPLGRVPSLARPLSTLRIAAASSRRRPPRAALVRSPVYAARSGTRACSGSARRNDTSEKFSYRPDRFESESRGTPEPFFRAVLSIPPPPPRGP